MHCALQWAAGCLASASAVLCWGADAWPNKPVHVIVPFGQGGGPDVAARIVSEQLGRQLARPFLVENRPAAGGIVGTVYVAKAPPDGYTLLLAGFSLTTLPAMSKAMPYDVNRDLTPIVQLVGVPNALVVSAESDIRSMKDLIAAAQRAPGRLYYASSGDGGINRLAPELLKHVTKIRIEDLRFKSANETLTAVVADQAQLVIAPVLSLLPLVKSGRFRALAVTTDGRRVPSIPDVPSMQEAGVPGMDIYYWSGFLGPAGLPRDIVNVVQRESVKALAVPAVKEAFNSQGAEVVGSSPEQFASLIQSELRRWTEVIRAAGIQTE